VEIRHQVFVSSTYVDLRDERQAIIQALLELECIPAGMEMFVATDEDQWGLIREVINLSDYYLVVVGARYGHVTDEAISYTEKEYNYALDSGKPIIAFVHGDPGSVAHDKTDKDPDKEKKLEDFRKRIRDGSDGKRRNVGEFKTADELAAKVSRAMSRAIKTYPGVGWVRGDQAMTVETQQEIIDLKQKINALESEKLAAETSLVEDVEQLAQGSDEITLTLYVADRTYPIAEREDTIYPKSTTTWDALFKVLAPLMLDEASEETVRNRVKSHLWNSNFMSDKTVEAIQARENDINYGVTNSSWDLVTVQLRALNLIDTGTKKRPIQDQDKYLTLTQKGRRHLMKLRAVKKGQNPAQADKDITDDEGEEEEE
jgi:hypothetical protein